MRSSSWRFPPWRTGGWRGCLDASPSSSSGRCSRPSILEHRAGGTVRWCCASRHWGCDPSRLQSSVSKISIGAPVRSGCAHARLVEVRCCHFHVRPAELSSRICAKLALRRPSVGYSSNIAALAVAGRSQATPSRKLRPAHFVAPESMRHWKAPMCSVTQ
jgi:hypothetical protein